MAPLDPIFGHDHWKQTVDLDKTHGRAALPSNHSNDRDSKARENNGSFGPVGTQRHTFQAPVESKSKYSSSTVGDLGAKCQSDNLNQATVQLLSL